MATITITFHQVTTSLLIGAALFGILGLATSDWYSGYSVWSLGRSGETKFQDDPLLRSYTAVGPISGITALPHCLKCEINVISSLLSFWGYVITLH